MTRSDRQRLRVLIANERPTGSHCSRTSSQGTPEELQSAIDITLQRFSEYHNLQGAFGRRAVIEQAKRILMARHALNADKAFAMLREHSNTMVVAWPTSPLQSSTATGFSCPRAISPTDCCYPVRAVLQAIGAAKRPPSNE